MILRFTSILFLFLIITSCTNKTNDKLTLFNGIEIKTFEGETEKAINQVITAKHQSYLDYKNIQIPLYKYLNHKDYEIFIGLPYRTSLKRIISTDLNNQSGKAISLEHDSISIIKKYKENNEFISTYITKFNDKSLLYFCVVSKSKEISDSLFNKFEISKRIIKIN